MKIAFWAMRLLQAGRIVGGVLYQVNTMKNKINNFYV
jgi:hypothetical protein